MQNYEVVMADTKPEMRNICRVGWGRSLSPLFLGDTSESWGWGGTGKKSHNGKYETYGTPFSVGDVVGCILDIDDLSISFTKNGRFCGVAFTNLPADIRETGCFPHLLLKNVHVRVNFSTESQWYPPPGKQVIFMQDLQDHELIPNPVHLDRFNN